ncbi:hypothetical protein [Streptomyces aureus]|uniref:hypothetical protein n=1 Tax=Streptomyces aureus TaxID=193461 RepID=UPI00363211CB
MTGPTTPESLWFLRVNPLRRTRLADPAQRRTLAELATAEEVLRQAADACSDELYHRIGAAADDAERRDLIALRRSIHNGRAPKKPPAPTPAVTEWLAARDARERLRDAVVEGYAEAADRERAGLAALLGDDDLLRSLALVAPEVHQEAERYRAAVLGPGKVSARTRKSERGLIQYVTRAMVRTSPLSRFTAVGIAEPDPAGVDPGDVPFEGATAFPGLDRVMLGYVLGGSPPPTPRTSRTCGWASRPPRRPIPSPASCSSCGSPTRACAASPYPWTGPSATCSTRCPWGRGSSPPSSPTSPNAPASRPRPPTSAYGRPWARACCAPSTRPRTAPPTTTTSSPPTTRAPPPSPPGSAPDCPASPTPRRPNGAVCSPSCAATSAS